VRDDDDDRPVKKFRNKNRTADDEDFAANETHSEQQGDRPQREAIELVIKYPSKRKGQTCFLSLEDDEVVLRDGEDEVLTSFPAAEANQVIRLPNIIDNANIVIGEDLAFEPKPEAVRAVRELIDDCLHANPEAASAAMRRKGIRDLIIGSVAFLLGIGITVWTFVSAPPGGTYYVMTGLIVVGIFEIIRGIYWMAKAGEV